MASHALESVLQPLEVQPSQRHLGTAITWTQIEKLPPLLQKRLESGLQAVRIPISVFPDGLKSGLQTLPSELPPGLGDRLSPVAGIFRWESCFPLRAGIFVSLRWQREARDPGLDGARPSTGERAGCGGPRADLRSRWLWLC